MEDDKSFIESVKSKNRYLPKLQYCKANVLHVHQDYRNMVQYGKDKDKAFQIKSLINEDGDKYIFLEHKKSQIYPKIVAEKWKSIKEDTFQKLVGLLHDKGFLTLYDNRLVYQSNEAIFHAMNNFYNNSPSLDFASLAGTYRTFNIALHDDNDVNKGRLDIKYIEDGNYLETNHDVYHRHHNQNDGIIYSYSGVITFYRDKNHLVMQDIPTQNSSDNGQNYRFHRFHITKFDNEGRIFEGVSWLDTNRTNVIRRMFIDNYLNESPYPEKDIVAIQRHQNDLPIRYKQKLIEDNVYNTFNLSGILG